jgi:hypothetical protein
MGNFVSIAGSYPTATSSSPPRPQGNTTGTHEPKPPLSTPIPPPSSARWSPLTSSLASHTRRLAKRLYRLTGMGGIRLTDVEEGLAPPDNSAAAVAAQVAQLSNPATSTSTRRRALLVGIAYHGELLNTHQDIDRYRDVLIGMFIGYLRNGGLFIHSYRRSICAR